MLLRIGPSAAAAISIASSQSVPPTNSPRSRRPVAGPVLSAPPTGHSGASWPSRASTASATAVRSRWPRPEQAELDRACRAPSAYSVECLGDLGRRRLGDHHDQVDVGVGVEPAQRLAGGEAADGRRTGRGRRRRARGGRRRPTSAAWSSSASSCWQPVPEAATMPIRPGADGVGEAEPDAVDDRGAAVGAHHQQRRARRRTRLSATSSADRHVVAEDHHVAAGLERVHRLDGGAGAGHRDQRERAGSVRRSALAGRARRGDRGVAGRRAGRAPAPRRPRRGPRDRRRRRRGAARRPCRWGRTPGMSKPMPSSTSRLRPVAIATCAVTTPGVACTARLTWSSVTESAYAPLRSSTWSLVGVVMQPSGGGVVRDRCRARARRRRGGRRPRWRRRRAGPRWWWQCGSASQSASWGSASPRERAVEQRRGQQGRARGADGVRPRRARRSGRPAARRGRRTTRPARRRRAASGPARGRRGGRGGRREAAVGGQDEAVEPRTSWRPSPVRPLLMTSDAGDGGSTRRVIRTGRSPTTSGRRAPGRPGRGRPRSGSVDQSAHGTRVAVADTRPRHQPSRSTYTAVRPAWTTRRGPSAAAASRSRTRSGAATGIGPEITPQTLTARATLANVRTCPTKG